MRSTSSHEVTLPVELKSCANCTLRLVRQALNWGSRYLFWSCADVNIVPGTPGCLSVKRQGSTYSITERGVPKLILVLGSQPAGDVSHKPGGTLPLLSARPAVTLANLNRAATNFAAW